MDYTETSTHTTSTSGSSYSASAPLRNVQFDPSNAGVIEEQQQKIQHLQEQLAEFNRVRYRTLSANASGGKNVVCTLKRKGLTATDQINQQAVASYLREAIWPSNKILPTKWSKWREDRNSLCQMILCKVAIPVGVDGKSYWESMILGFTNEKFCALRANFKQELFEQFQGKFSRINICIAAYSNNQYLFAEVVEIDVTVRRSRIVRSGRSRGVALKRLDTIHSLFDTIHEFFKVFTVEENLMFFKKS